jgi:hypothetical protein
MSRVIQQRLQVELCCAVYVTDAALHETVHTSHQLRHLNPTQEEQVMTGQRCNAGKARVMNMATKNGGHNACRYEPNLKAVSTFVGSTSMAF